MQSVCGIDVSKDRLDIMVLPEQQCFSVRNDAAGWAELIARLRGFTIAAIGLEASGGYERGETRGYETRGGPIAGIGSRLAQMCLSIDAKSRISKRCPSSRK
jgi:transposase